ncbi:MAG: murein biosynthesis integral membrane protein MurJ [Spirochaetes bacterium]|nr:murein biosynthesis integral membrane protein MurJ [Spirochaetota bacterium]
MEKKRNRIKDLFRSSIAIIISRILGLLRDAFTTHYFSLNTLDAFTAAFKIPNTFRSLFAEGSLNNSFVPIYCSIENDKDKEEYLSSFFTNFFIILFFSVLFLIIIADKFVPFLVYGFSSFSLEKTNLTILYTRYFFIYLFFISIVSFIAAILNAGFHFFSSYFNQVYFNFTFIIIIIISLLLKKLNNYTLIYCVVISGLTQMLIMFLFLIKYKIKIKFKINFKNIYLKESWKLFLTSLISSSAYQINILFSTFFLSFFQGANTYTYIAQRLYLLPVGLFSEAFSQVFLAYFSHSKEISKKDEELNYSLRLSFFISLPIIAYFLAFSEQILKILFFHGKYTINDIYYSNYLLMFYMPGMLFVSLNKTFVSYYYSLKKIRFPVINSILSIIIFIILNIILMPFFKLYTVAISNTISLILQTSFFNIVYRTYNKNNKTKINIEKTISIIKYFLINLMLFILFYILNKNFKIVNPIKLNFESLKVFITFCFLSFSFFILFILSSLLIKNEEIKVILNIFLKKFENKNRKDLEK